MGPISMMSRTRRERGFVSHLVMFVVVAALTGTLVAGLAIPFAGVIGLTTRSVTDAFQNMNGDLEEPPLPERSRLLAADGSLIATFYERNRVQVKLDQIAPVMQRAILAIEDARFYHHGPLDAQGTVRAFVRNQQGGGVSQGGSSITQQYVKLVLFENAKTAHEQEQVIEDSYGRKLQELRYAVELEKRMTKDEILERYLNIVYFGDGAYGVQAAAKHYFNTSAPKLTLKQAAMLAGLVRDPNGLDARQNPDAVFGRRNLVLSRMVHEGMISEKVGARTVKSGLGLRMTQTASGCYTSPYPFFCDYAEQVLLADPALGRTREDRQRLIDRGGLTIRTTLDPKAQKAADKAVLETAFTTDSAVAALSMVEPGTGEVKAMAQSRKFGKGKGRTFVNFNVPKRYNGGIGFSPGSTYKTMVMAAAIRQGIPLSATFPSPHAHHDQRRRTDMPRGQAGCCPHAVGCAQLDRSRASQQHAQRHGPLGEHVLRQPRGEDRHLRACRHRDQARRHPRRRQAVGAVQAVRARQQRGRTGVDGRGVCVLRRPRSPLPGHPGQVRPGPRPQPDQDPRT